MLDSRMLNFYKIDFIYTYFWLFDWHSVVQFFHWTKLAIAVSRHEHTCVADISNSLWRWHHASAGSEHWQQSPGSPDRCSFTAACLSWTLLHFLLKTQKQNESLIVWSFQAPHSIFIRPDLDTLKPESQSLWAIARWLYPCRTLC